MLCIDAFYWAIRKVSDFINDNDLVMTIHFLKKETENLSISDVIISIICLIVWSKGKKVIVENLP